MCRQILKCNNYKMEPYVISKGYDKCSGKKIVERYYRIKDLNIDERSKDESINNKQINESINVESINVESINVESINLECINK